MRKLYLLDTVIWATVLWENCLFVRYCHLSHSIMRKPVYLSHIMRKPVYLSDTVRYQDSIISILAKSSISRLASLCSWVGWSQTPKIGFLVMWNIYFRADLSNNLPYTLNPGRETAYNQGSPAPAPTGTGTFARVGPPQRTMSCLSSSTITRKSWKLPNSLVVFYKMYLWIIWATTRQNVSSGVSDQARHKLACTATEAS